MPQLATANGSLRKPSTFGSTSLAPSNQPVADLLSANGSATATQATSTTPGCGVKIDVVTKVVHLFRLHRKGWRGSPWTKVKGVGLEEYSDLRRRLEEDQDLRAYVEHKVRYDFNLPCREIVIRMPKEIHEVLLYRVIKCIQDQLDNISNHQPEPVATLTRDVTSRLSTDIWLRSDPDQAVLDFYHSPDTSFAHADAGYPGVVIEVSYSAKRKDLPRLADHYIIGSLGLVRVVIGIDVEYRGSGIAVLTWRPKIEVDEAGMRTMMIEQTSTSELSGSDAAGLLDDSVLLTLRDFLPPGDFANVNPNPTIEISHAKLQTYLNEGERIKQITQPEELLRITEDVRAPNLRFTRWKSSSPEELRSEDEAEFQRQEEMAVVLQEDNDGAFRARSLGSPQGDWQQRLRSRGGTNG